LSNTRPPYYVTQTLLGGAPDVNRRTIRRLSTDDVVAEFNRDMRPWTEDMERELQWCLAALLKLAANDRAATELLFPKP